MVKLTIAPFDYRREVSKGNTALLKNRYFEKNPVLSEDEFSLIARPGLKKFLNISTDPSRRIYSAPGAFDGSAFSVHGIALYKIKKDGTTTNCGNLNSLPTTSVTMAATGTIGDGAEAVPNFLFISDGGALNCYTDNGFARGHLEITGDIINNETVTIGLTVYKFTSGAVDAGTPAGTAANPWLVALGATAAISLKNLYYAINKDSEGIAGSTYSTALVAHVDVIATNYNSTDFYIRARGAGVGGNAIVTTETGAAMAWTATTLAAGGTAGIVQVPLPGDVGAISVAHINGYVIVIPAQGFNLNGRFYWIDPGETTIDPLNFATAERSPDAVFQVVVFSDQFWLCGQNTTETWITTGDPDAPMQRFQGVLFDRGVWEGTAIQIKDSLFTIDSDGGVFQIGGGLKRVSTPQIEERIRKSIFLQQTG